MTNAKPPAQAIEIASGFFQPPKKNLNLGVHTLEVDVGPRW